MTVKVDDLRPAAAAFDVLAGFTFSEQLAGFLMEEKIRGATGDPKRCPLAVWLSARTGDCWHVGDDGARDGRGAQRPLTSAMATFIYDFDEGHWPELIGRNV